MSHDALRLNVAAALGRVHEMEYFHSTVERTSFMTHQMAPAQPAGNEPLLISADHLARLLGISTRSIWRRLSVGELVEPVRIGGSVRWRVDEVKEWIAAGCPSRAGSEERGR